MLESRQPYDVENAAIDDGFLHEAFAGVMIVVVKLLIALAKRKMEKDGQAAQKKPASEAQENDSHANGWYGRAALLLSTLQTDGYLNNDFTR